MARCGCQGGCSCSVQGSGLVKVSGNGAASAPFTVGLSCEEVVECVGGSLDAPLAYDEVTGQLQVQTSADPGNLVSVGSDGGLFVPTAGASAGLVEGQAVDITGDQAAGYTIGARISADPRNGLSVGSDGGLYVPAYEVDQGVTFVSFTNRTSYTRVITFAVPFSSPPVMSIGIQSGAGPTARWHVRAITVTETSFTIFAFYGELPLVSGTWASVPIQWRAMVL